MLCLKFIITLKFWVYICVWFLTSKGAGMSSFANDTANPSTANMPPPTIPPIPIDIASFKLIFFGIGHDILLFWMISLI